MQIAAEHKPLLQAAYAAAKAGEKELLSFSVSLPKEDLRRLAALVRAANAGEEFVKIYPEFELGDDPASYLTDHAGAIRILFRHI